MKEANTVQNIVKVIPTISKMVGITFPEHCHNAVTLE